MKLPAAWERPLRALPGLILASVAARQIFLAATVGLSPWHGGGFGMFASTDAGGSRHLHAFVLRPGLRREVQLPGSAQRIVEDALTLPTEANLRSVAREAEKIPTPDFGPPTAILLQVWRTEYDPESLVPNSLILRSLEVAPRDG